jgi:hypothetical protein
MGTITTTDGTQIFYKDWARTCRPHPRVVIQGPMRASVVVDSRHAASRAAAPARVSSG